MHKIGLVGYGAFGRFITEQLSDTGEFVIYDPQTKPDRLAETLRQPVIVLALPAQYLGGFLTENHQLLPENALYVDVCSVKVQPVKDMTELLPAASSIIATHPLFGPASAQSGLAGQKIAVHRVRADDTAYHAFISFLADYGLRVLEVTPEEHDRAMAYAQGLSHYIGRIMQQMAIPGSELSTQAYQDLLDMKNIQGNDSADLFQSIVGLNPYTLDVLRQFDAARLEVDAQFDIQ